jgi:hypothetical protein
MDPSQTSFFQALAIATKINKGTIEIVSDVHLIKAGDKVGGAGLCAASSWAAEHMADKVGTGQLAHTRLG